MLIGINASALTHPNPTGVQRYTEYILLYMLKLKTEHEFLLYTPAQLPEEFKEHQRVIKSPTYWTQIRLPIELILHKPDVFFQPSYMLPPLNVVKSVAVVHDLGWLKYPKAYSEMHLQSEYVAMKRIVQQKAHIIVPSVSVQQDLLEHYEIAPEMIHVIHEALIDLPQPVLSDFPEIEKYKNRPIILAVGRFEVRKNTLTLVKAFAQIAGKNKEGDKPVLVLLGQTGYGAEGVFEAIKEARFNGSDIIINHKASDAEVAAWLSIANVYAYPSLYEGFGLPILQAFAASVPVVTTHISSLPEVAGDAALYINDPWNEDELAAAMNSLVYSKEKSQKLIELGLKQLEHFSWETAAKQTLAVITKK